MSFSNWLNLQENMAETEDIGNHIFNSIKYILNGDWRLKDTKQSPNAGWYLQNLISLEMTGRNVVEKGDIYVINAIAHILKRPQEDLDKVEDPFGGLPSWENEPNQWGQAAQYHKQEGHELLNINATIHGWKPGLNIADYNRQFADKYLSKFHTAKPIKRGSRGLVWVDSKDNLKTPIEVAHYAKNTIDHFSEIY